MLRRTFLVGAPTLLAACTPSLGVFNALAPRDAGARLVVRDAAYAPGPRRRLAIYAPAAAAAPSPVIVFLYGGSWTTGDKDDYAFVGAALAARGFLAAIPDYRLVPQVRFPTFIEDCAAAIRWLVDHAARHGGDPDRIVLVGHSAGAYNAMMLALDARYLRDAGVDAQRVRGVVGLAGPYDFLPFDVDATRNAFGQASDPQLTQPVRFARGDAPPLLLLWGEDDATVSRRSIQNLERAMRAAGGAVEARTYPGVDHVDIMLALSQPLRRRAPTLEDIVAFARRVTG